MATAAYTTNTSMTITLALFCEYLNNQRSYQESENRR
jgi:hypothetical protein